jgi:hypothetical protein
MPGIFKKLSANDIKITPFEAHKTYSNTNLSSLGASADFVYWSPYNKAFYNDGNRKYSQIDKLYYRDYIRERAHRLELDDATYTTQERRLYEYANVISLSQKTFGSEIQPSTFILSCSYSSSEEQFDIRDDGFGNLYDVNRGKDNFPNEDYRLIYIGPTQAFKRADLTIDYETGNKYVNNPFPDGYVRTVYDDSYFLNEVEFNNVNFITSSNSGFYAIKTPKAKYKATESVDLQSLYNNGNITITLGAGDSETASSGGPSKLFDGINNATGEANNFSLDSGDASDLELFTINFSPPLKTNTATVRTWNYYTAAGTDIDIYINANPNTSQSFTQTNPFLSQQNDATFTVSSSLLTSITYVGQEAFGGYAHQFQEVELDIAPADEITSFIKLPHQPQYNFETNDDFTINFYYDLNTIDHTNSTIDGDYYILTKEGNKTVPILPSETNQHTPLSRSGSSQIGTAPIGGQFPYRIYYKGNHPTSNEASLFFERSDGESTQFVSASFFTSGSTETQKFISCKNDNGVLKLKINTDTETSSSGQNSSPLSKTVSNKANITLYNKPNPNGSYSNFIGYNGGQISQLMMWNQTLSTTEITNVSESIVGTPNIGNIFYDNGFAVVTHPNYRNVLNNYDTFTLNSIVSASITSSDHPNIHSSFRAPAELEFNNDGTKLFISSIFSPTNGAITEYNLSTPYDISTLEGVKSYRSSNSPLPYQATGAQGFRFTPNGDKLIISKNVTTSNNYYSYQLSSSFDIGSAYDEQVYSLPQTSSGMTFGNNGYTLLTGDNKGNLRQYKLSDPYELDNFTLEYTYSLGSAYLSKTVSTLRFDPTGYKLFCTALPASKLFYFELDRPYDIRSIKNVFTKSLDYLDPLQISQLSYASGLEFNSDGTKIYFCAQTNSASQRARDLIYQLDLDKSINRFEYKNTHLITENEYQCTMTEDEFEFTTNTSIRKIPFSDNEDIANFATGSNFKPYITTVGLYDDEGNLLVVGKLGQPIKASSETDTTFVIRFDT